MVKEFTYDEVEEMYEWCVRNNKGNFPVSDVIKKTLWSILKSSLSIQAAGYTPRRTHKKIMVGLWEEEWKQIKHCCLKNSNDERHPPLDLIDKL